MARRSCGEGILPAPFSGARSLCSTCTSRGSRGERIPSTPSQNQRSFWLTCTSRENCGECIPPSPSQGQVALLRSESSREPTLTLGAPQTDRRRQRWVRMRDRWTVSATPSGEDRCPRRERRTHRAGGEEARWFWRVISESNVDWQTVRVGLARRLKVACGRFGSSGRVVS